MTIYILIAVTITSPWIGPSIVQLSDPLAFRTYDKCYQTKQLNLSKHPDWSMDCVPVYLGENK